MSAVGKAVTDKSSRFSWATVAAGGSAAVAIVPPMNATGSATKQVCI